MMRTCRMIFFALAAALAFSALHARTVGDFFVAATGDAVHALPQNKRAEMLAYLREAGRVVPAETEYGEEAAMLRATDNYLKVRLSAASELEMLMLTQGRDTVIYMVQTVLTPAPDSRIMAINPQGKILNLDKLFKAPQMKDFVRIPRGSKLKTSQVLAAVRFPLISYSIDDSLLTITARHHTEAITPADDYKLIAPCLADSLVYRPAGIRFKKVKK